MRKSKMDKMRKELNRRYGKLAESMDAYYHHLDLRKLDQLDDDGFAYIMPKVKGVNMLDLNETEIGNDSIKLLTTLEYVKELRLKGCHNVNNDCIGDLNKIKQLEFLHLNHTGITIDGLLKLGPSAGLKTLLFSADDVDDLGGKMKELRKLLPSCEFVVNSRPYLFDEEINVFPGSNEELS